MTEHKITHQPEWDAVHAFDAERGIEPFITTADRIVSKYRLASGANELALEISHALEDAYNLGEARGPLVAKAKAASLPIG